MVADNAFVGLIILATVALLRSFYLSVTLGLLSRKTRTGRVVFGTIASLKLFVLLILLDFYVAAWQPAFIQGHRGAIRWGLIVYLVVQTIGSNVALSRFRRYGEK